MAPQRKGCWENQLNGRTAKLKTTGRLNLFVKPQRMADFKNLRVWKRAHSLALCAHQTALTIRGSRYASLRSQIIRASMSIPANIVEGREQKSEPEFCRFLRYASSSASELEYDLIIARDIDIISEAGFVGVLTPLKEVRMMLFGLLKRLDSKKVGAIERDTAVERDNTSVLQ